MESSKVVSVHNKQGRPDLPATSSEGVRDPRSRINALY